MRHSRLITLSIDASQLAAEVAFAQTLKPRTRALVWTQIRVASFNAERYIKIAMPVDTGRARASWGHYSGGGGALRDAKGRFIGGSSSSVVGSTPADSIWDEDEAALAITQGSRVPYIEQLNDGWSKQAPAGFIDAAERRAVQELTDAIIQRFGDTFT